MTFTRRCEAPPGARFGPFVMPQLDFFVRNKGTDSDIVLVERALGDPVRGTDQPAGVVRHLSAFYRPGTVAGIGFNADDFAGFERYRCDDRAADVRAPTALAAVPELMAHRELTMLHGWLVRPGRTARAHNKGATDSHVGWVERSLRNPTKTRVLRCLLRLGRMTCVTSSFWNRQPAKQSVADCRPPASAGSAASAPCSV